MKRPCMGWMSRSARCSTRVSSGTTTRTKCVSPPTHTSPTPTCCVRACHTHAHSVFKITLLLFNWRLCGALPWSPLDLALTPTEQSLQFDKRLETPPTSGHHHHHHHRCYCCCCHRHRRRHHVRRVESVGDCGGGDADVCDSLTVDGAGDDLTTWYDDEDALTTSSLSLLHMRR